MPCEVVACIVVLPLPVGSLLGISCLLLVGIYLHDLPQISALFAYLHFKDLYWLFAISQYMKLHVTVIQQKGWASPVVVSLSVSSLEV